MECVPNVSGAIFLEDGIMPPLNVSGECVWGLIVRFYNIILLFRISKKNSISVYIFKDKLVIIIRPCFLNRISNKSFYLRVKL